jgi:hypothetical protein
VIAQIAALQRAPFDCLLVAAFEVVERDEEVLGTRQRFAGVADKAGPAGDQDGFIIDACPDEALERQSNAGGGHMGTSSSAGGGLSLCRPEAKRASSRVEFKFHPHSVPVANARTGPVRAGLRPAFDPGATWRCS